MRLAKCQRYWGKSWYLRQDSSQTSNLPAVGSETSEVDHGSDHANHDHIHPLEAFPNLGNFREEVGVVLLLGCGTPTHVDAEHVRADGEEDMEGNTTKEDHEEGHPLEVLKEGTEQTGLTNTVAHDGEADVGHSVEDDKQDDEDLPRFDVVLVKVTVEPSDEEVVEGSKGNSRTESVVGEDITANGDLG